MNEQPDKLSLILDEFADQESNLTVLDDLLADVNLQNKMHRYQMIGEVMRHELPQKIDTGFSQSVMARVRALDSDDGQSLRLEVPAKTRLSFWRGSFFKPVAGLAIAASVAIVSVTLWQTATVNQISDQSGGQLASSDRKKIDRLAQQSVLNNVITASSQLNSGMHWKVENNTPALQQKLNAYLINHTEYSNSIQGLIPQARVAGFDSEE